MKREIYLDHAATTPVRSEVLEAMLPYLSDNYGNPSSLYAVAEQAKDAIEESRRKVSGVLNCRPDEVVFTSGGTESDNAAIKGVALAMKEYGNHIITTAIEHHAVLDSCHFLEKHFGFDVTYLPVDEFGLVNPDDLTKNLNDRTVLVTVMYANNEIGTIQPIRELGEIVNAHQKDLDRPLPFHTDAVQAAGYLDLDVDKLCVDLMSLSGHKIYGPKGIGALYLKANTPFIPYQSGGGQERGIRSGTENVPSIVGMGIALCEASAERTKESRRCSELRDQLIKKVLNENGTVKLNGNSNKRLPNNVNFTFEDIDGEMLLMHLAKKGIFTSTGSACSTSSPEPSHVILALGTEYESAWGSLRVTLGRSTNASDIFTLAEEIRSFISDK